MNRTGSLFWINPAEVPAWALAVGNEVPLDLITETDGVEPDVVARVIEVNIRHTGDSFCHKVTVGFGPNAEGGAR